ncbi:MAG: cytochrome C [Ignavibacteriales bacterium CG_4_9_14_3_um_filter_34_10]|nr:MAG: cytochrome C [Ignavibacteriales bacterium CG_4_9_14_3_um_filter_34_10]
MKTKYLYISMSLLLTVFIFIAAAGSNNNQSQPSNKEVIKFSHILHIDNGTECESCHSNVLNAESLNERLLPSMEQCAACHDVEDDNNCTQCHYDGVFEKVIQSKSEILFNHKLHVTNNMKCTDCHQGLDKVNYSFEAAQLKPTMSKCYECHNDQTVATNNCEICHASTAELIPENHKVVNFNKKHKFIAEGNAECQMCHDNNFCESCHVSTVAIDETNTASDFYAPYSPHRFTDNAKQQQLSRVHEINYRFTHGIDLKGKTSECQTCHETETFCVECHTGANEDYAIGGVVPNSHTAPNFLTIGVGTGGGIHATLAKRDIERCASCHDVEGADPTCITCHVDNDGVKGTNPSTHEKGFMKSIRGDWHDDFGSTCFNCHTDHFALSRSAGNGFCGYCHGSNVN